jgi:hypothetical protein
VRLDRWEEPDPGELIILTGPADWDALKERYVGGFNAINGPLDRCLEVAKANGATTAIIETRYIDPDYRSEFSAYYSRAFRTVPDTAHRIHFFRAPLVKDQLWSLPDDVGYLGYIVIRPIEHGQVGRTMLAAPLGAAAAVRTAIVEEVTLFGQALIVTAAPFVQQDTQLDRCAHVAAWMCHYPAAKRGDVARRSMASFSLMADASLSPGRVVPSEGLTVVQLADLFRVFDLPPRVYNVWQLPSTSIVSPTARPDPQPPQPNAHPGTWDSRMISICCRYLNSGYPILVGTQEHAFVLVGYTRESREGGEDWIRFVRHDDQRGPYLWVDDVFNDEYETYRYTPWECLIVPLPEKVWLPPEPAEGMGGLLMHAAADRLAGEVPDAEVLTRLSAEDRLALRTYITPANRFKHGLAGRVDQVVLREYRLARWSRYIDVVEAVDRDRRERGEPCVLGEAVFDATSTDRSPEWLGLHVPGAVWIRPSDGGSRGPIRCGPDPYPSGGVGPP